MAAQCCCKSLGIATMFPISSIIFLVCQDVADVDLLAIEVDRGNESIFVSADVEHDEIADLVCTWKCRSQSGKSWKVILLHNFEPARQRIFAVWMHRPKL